ncbi:MAG: heavy metal translocating P-type ATPase, partial [Pseudomonadota bacterium]
AEAPLSELLERIAALGFRPQPTVYGERSLGAREHYRQALKRLLVAAAAGMQVMMFAVALYAGAFSGIERDMEQFFRAVSLLVATPVVFYSARPFFAGALRGLRTGRPGMDVPVALAIGIAYTASLLATLSGSGEVYFDSVVMFVLFLSVARFLEMRSRHRAESHVAALASLLPDDVVRIRAGVRERCDIDALAGGDCIAVAPGDVVAADGIVVDGELELDEAVLSGESQPVRRGTGAAVIAGAQNRAGHATVRVTATGAGTRLAEIGRLIESAQADRPPVVVLADRIAMHFVAGLLLLAAGVGLFWWFADPARALPIVLATLVVTCPCALALATPAALASAATRLAERGLLLIRARLLSVLTPGTVIVFDKTGTLTRGQPTVTQVDVVDARETTTTALALAAAIEDGSEHVLARAFADVPAAAAHAVSARQTVAGAGVAATIDGVRYRIGRADFVAELTGLPGEPPDDEQTLVYLGRDGGLVAVFTIGDALRADAAEALTALTGAGFEVAIASGDRPGVVAKAAAALGVEHWHGGLTPEAKVGFVRSLRADGRRVVMVGDGINDAPVLAAADGSVAMDAGTALARASADAIVPGKRLLTLAELAAIAAATRRIVRQNLAWALGYNLAAIPLAASGWLAPWMAAIGMSASSLIVVVNALRLRRYRSAAGTAAAPALAEAAT